MGEKGSLKLGLKNLTNLKRSVLNFPFFSGKHENKRKKVTPQQYERRKLLNFAKCKAGGLYICPGLSLEAIRAERKVFSWARKKTGKHGNAKQGHSRDHRSVLPPTTIHCAVRMAGSRQSDKMGKPWNRPSSKINLDANSVTVRVRKTGNC